MAWNGSDNGKATSANSPSGRGGRPACPHSRGLVKGLVALALIAVLGGAAIYFLMPGDAPVVAKEKTTKPGAITEVTPAPAGVAIDDASQTAPVEPDQPEEKSAPQKDLGTVFHARTSSDGDVVTLMDGTVVTNYPPKPIFKRDLERTLQVALRPGGMSRALIDILLQRHSEAEIEDMLKDMTVPDADDPENIKNIKSDVQGLKERILLEVRNGRSIRSVFEEIKQTGMRENYVRVETMKMRAEAIRSGDAQSVQDTVEAANKVRAENGLDPMTVPDQFKPPETEPRNESVSEGDGPTAE